MNVLLLQLDGKIPNLALMRLAAHHRQLGHNVELKHVRNNEPAGQLLWESWDKVYASAIFTRTSQVVARVRSEYPGCIVGGTGVDLGKPAGERQTLESLGVAGQSVDYFDYSECSYSLGFTQRGCRLSCRFCDVPAKEGKPSAAGTIKEIWRGEPYPKKIMLLDNDFFGGPHWEDVCEELLVGDFRVCFTQGINARLLPDAGARWLGKLKCRDNNFERRRIYTAWDSIGDEGPLMRGLKRLIEAGFRPDNIEVYMLVGEQEPRITDDDLYRHRKLREFGCRPFPMPFIRNDETRGFQRWVVRRADLKVSWDKFKAADYRPEKCGAFQ